MYGSIGKLGLSGIRCATNQAIAHCVPNRDVDAAFLMLALRSMRRALLARGQGGTQPNISQTILKAWPISIPPLAEQHRIVAKVDELMAVCDQLGAAQAEREQRRGRLAVASLGRLTAPHAESEVSFQRPAKSFLTHFNGMVTRPPHLAALRATIVDLAVRGKLLPQELVEGHAAALELEEMRRLARRRGKQLLPVPVTLDQEPFSIPSSWCWARLADLADIVRGITFSASDKSTSEGPQRVACLRSGNVQSDVTWTNLLFVPRAAVRNDSQLVHQDDILISIANSYALVGKNAIATQVPFESAFGAFLAAIRLATMSPQFVHRALSSTYSAQAFRAGSAQTTNIANITFGGSGSNRRKSNGYGPGLLKLAVGAR